MSKNRVPYQDLPPENFWRTAAVEPGPFGLQKVCSPKFDITKQDRVVTFGSCFAQRVSQALVERGYNWVDAEPAPAMMALSSRRLFNYGAYSARTGNIYTVAMLRQWVAWAFDGLPKNLEVWSDGKRYQDPFRPEIEPGGFQSEDELLRSRNNTLKAIREGLTSADVFIFTFGGTEFWRNTATGLVYPSCPGTVAGEFEQDTHAGHNSNFRSNYDDMKWIIERLRLANPDLRILLTVSPIPITATFQKKGHVLPANTYAKSLLRTLAGILTEEYDFLDYFPSYEMCVGTPASGRFFESNLRTISSSGVNFIMDKFLQAFDPEKDNESTEQCSSQGPVSEKELTEEDLICHEYALEQFSGS